MSAGLAWESSERLLTFAVGGGIYALPIASVLEVTEVVGNACIPTVPPGVAWVMNYHGDALPVVRSMARISAQLARSAMIRSTLRARASN